MSKIVKVILTLACVALSFAGISIYNSMSNDKKLEESTTITIEKEMTKTLVVEIDDLYPTCEKQYTINIGGDDAGKFYISLNFRSKDTGILKEYIDVEIKSGAFDVKRSLKDLLDNNEIISLDNKVNEIIIIYSMREEAENETQGTELSFYLDITAKESK